MRLSISTKTVRSILSLLDDGPVRRDVVGAAVIAELERALSRAAPRRKAKPSKRAETARIREDIFARAEGRCEVTGCGQRPEHMHHVFGRRVPQSHANCVAICHACHRDWHASPSCYLPQYVERCERFGYHAEAERASARIQSLEAKGFPTREGNP